MQQCLPLAVLKLDATLDRCDMLHTVATVLTACGIETCRMELRLARFQRVATVLTACGIETVMILEEPNPYLLVATVLTACGIETLLLLM